MHEKFTPVWPDKRLKGIAVTGSSPIEGGGSVHRSVLISRRSVLYKY